VLLRSIPEDLCETVAAMWRLLDSREKSIEQCLLEEAVPLVATSRIRTGPMREKIGSPKLRLHF